MHLTNKSLLLKKNLLQINLLLILFQHLLLLRLLLHLLRLLPPPLLLWLKHKQTGMQKLLRLKRLLIC